MNLQSGFVLAVIFAIVVFIDRLGGTREGTRKLFQLALGATLAFTVAAGTVAIVEPDLSEGENPFLAITTGNEDDQLDAQDISNRSVIANAVRFGAGVVALLFGIGGMARWSTIPLGVTLGGVLLILIGGGGNEIFGFASFVSASARSSREVDFAYFAVLLAGLGALFWYGFNEWENESLDEEQLEPIDEAAPDA
jgi:hypothetical protein